MSTINFVLFGQTFILTGIFIKELHIDAANFNLIVSHEAPPSNMFPSFILHLSIFKIIMSIANLNHKYATIDSSMMLYHLPVELSTPSLSVVKIEVFFAIKFLNII